MIWIIGGTKDSRDFLESVSQKRRDIVVSTATAYGGKLLEGLGVEVHTKAMNVIEMKEFVEKFSVTCIVDMSHPYAYEVSQNAIQVAEELKLEYYRFERKLLECFAKNYKIFSSIEEILGYLEQKTGNILVTLGSNLLPKFKLFSRKKDCYFRMLPKWDMVKKAEEQEILPKQILAMQGRFSKEMNVAMIHQYEIQYLITKRSGDTGGEREKREAADETGVEILYLDRPQIIYPDVSEDWKEIEEKIEKNPRKQ